MPANVAVLGCLHDPNGVPLCLSLSSDSGTSTRSSAADALGMIVELNLQVVRLVYDDLVDSMCCMRPANYPISFWRVPEHFMKVKTAVVSWM